MCGSLVREALWFKVGHAGISDNMVNSINKMYAGIEFSVQGGEAEVGDFVEQKRSKARV
jgi:hypothetical protein